VITVVIINDDHGDNVSDVCRPYRRHVQWISTLSIDGRVRGITQLGVGGKVYVVTAKSSVVYVFDDCFTSPARRRHQPTLHVRGLKVSWMVVGKLSAIGQLTRPTQPFIVSGSIN